METPATSSTSKSDIPKTSKASGSSIDRPNQPNTSDKTSDNNGTTGSFECNICLDSARDAVVSMCGHLFCWPCLHRWLETSESRTVCPVCKAAISSDKVIPLYGRGADHTQDPRTKIPPRPAGRRTEPEPGIGSLGSTWGGLFGGSDGGNFRMSVGIGAFPFGFLSTTFNLGSNGSSGNSHNANGINNRGIPPDNFWGADSETMSKICLFIAIFFIGWLLIA
ncbi:E3 ubiquitin-protein ligase [Schistosoma japonicum]|nr:similar to GenBank Accession Number AJ428489 putative ubiquitin ligase in Taenia solium [Schistosoma japonicum]KAH8876139.1 E3 ubiquitin-protein ligase [Schistosoma japonicum]KAH8876140.1 E3 ubiquitin-protein ligase [Schistosoma japonicum]KAH8876141.1 E3 ubiquitin-protein ligase [Schistosoma japonicum]KAH8876143.1 E3 ubiquitin-protein ligase [Schistosoma japonicum]